MIRDRLIDPTDYSSIDRETTRLSPFLVGALAGAAVALLFAPMTGRESRARLRDGANRLRGAGDGLRGAKDALQEGAHAVRDAVETGKDAVRESVAAAREGFNKAREEVHASATGAPGTTPGTRTLSASAPEDGQDAPTRRGLVTARGRGYPAGKATLDPFPERS